MLGRTGEPFWQRESYDHWVRNLEEWQRIAAYIENNPVKAGVVSQAEEYRWASAHATWRAKLDPPSVGTSDRRSLAGTSLAAETVSPARCRRREVADSERVGGCLERRLFCPALTLWVGVSCYMHGQGFM